MKKYILFGAGNFGRDALVQIGNDNVEYFCDNNPDIEGTEKFGKNIISFNRLKTIFKDYVIVLCVNFEKAYIIAEQLESNDIYDYIPFVMFRYSGYGIDWWEDILKDVEKRSNIKCQFYKKKIKDLETQVDYFKRHADIKTMKPATGKLRKHQLDEINALNEFEEVYKKLDIKPFLCSGNLLGYIRHNGFIPWDDDMDLSLVRDEYERLKKYCFDNFQVICSENMDTSPGEPDKFFTEHTDEWCVLEYYTHFQIAKMDKNKNIASIDYFVIDYYDDKYSYNEHKKYLSLLYQEIIKEKNDSDKIKIVKKELSNNKYIVKDSNNLYFGIDNMMSYCLYNKGKWISKDIIFPLHKVIYEGINVWIPNKAEEYLEYEFDHIYNFPNDVGIQRHKKYEES